MSNTVDIEKYIEAQPTARDSSGPDCCHPQHMTASEHGAGNRVRNCMAIGQQKILQMFHY